MIAWSAAAAYVCGMFGWAVSWSISWSRAKKDSYELRTAARMILLTPIWPFMLVLMAGILIVELWKDADWGNG
jgi:H+/Cl- antiporter ClcA